MEIAILAQRDQIQAQIETQSIRSLHKYQIDFFSSVLTLVSNCALNLILEQYRTAKAASKENPLPPCHCSITQTHGIPCCHDIFHLLNNKIPLKQSQIHVHWWLQNRHMVPEFSFISAKAASDDASQPSTLPTELEAVTIKNPLVVKGKGRPLGSVKKQKADSSTKREPSHFEYVESNVKKSGRKCTNCNSIGHNIRTCPHAKVSQSFLLSRNIDL